MRYLITFFLLLLFTAQLAGAASVRRGTTSRQLQNYISADGYNYMYPYMDNTMRTSLNPGTTPSQSNNPIQVIARVSDGNGAPRRVVPRRQSTARAATPTHTPNTQSGTMRAATNNGNANGRRVVPRRTSTVSAARAATNFSAPRTANNRTAAARNAETLNTTYVQTQTSARCLADYTTCMNNYCERKNTLYNRCYCSSKLAQIDSVYKPAVDALVQQIIMLKYNNASFDLDDFNDYWMNNIGKYVGENTWNNIDDALNIDWPTTELRAQGQNAFSTGHAYCVQHLRGCGYMVTNLRDAYVSEISRDCTSYEKTLLNLKTAAESVVENYND